MRSISIKQLVKNSSFFSKIITDSLSVKVFRLMVIVLPLLSYAYGGEKINTNTDSTTVNYPIKISIAKGTLMYGMENLHDAEVVIVKSDVKKGSKKVIKHTLSQEITIELSQKKEKIKTAEKVKYDQVSKKVDIKYSTNSTGNSNYSKKPINYFAAVFSPFNILQNTAVKSLDVYQMVAINVAFKKQKFFTSLSYLQFDKYKSSSLRGPPQHS